MKTFLYSADDSYRSPHSSSGGAFFTLAKCVIEKGGVVYGAAYDKGRVRYTRAANLSEIDAQSGSKYVRANIDGVFPRIRDDLRDGLTVLFCGTPCYVFALKRFLVGEQTDNLFTVDFICHGVIKQGIWDMYLKEFSISTESAIDFRDKALRGRYGWSLSFRDEDGVIVDDYLGFFFRTNYALEESCFSCKHKGENRLSDMTIGDAWCLKNRPIESLALTDGVSLVLSRNDALASMLVGHGRIVPVGYVDSFLFGENPQYLEASKKPADYEEVNQTLIRQGILKAWEGLNEATTIVAPSLRLRNRLRHYARRLLNLALQFTPPHCGSRSSSDVDIVTIPGYYNFGNRLQNFALSTFLKSLGLSVSNFYFSSPDTSHYCNPKMLASCRKYEGRLHVGPGSPKPRMGYLFGSDQIWNYNYFGRGVVNNLGYSLRHFGKPLFSYAASVGEGRIDKLYSGVFQECLGYFENISVREESTVGEFKALGYESRLDVDPCFLLTDSEWENVIHKRAKAKAPIAPYELFACFFDKESIAQKVGEDFDVQLGRVDVFSPDVFNSLSQFDFIALIKNAERIITDSYHCLVFSIIFKKKTHVFFKKDGLTTEERMKTVLSYLGIDRSIQSGTLIDFNELDYSNLFERSRSSRAYLSGLFLDSSK